MSIEWLMNDGKVFKNEEQASRIIAKEVNLDKIVYFLTTNGRFKASVKSTLAKERGIKYTHYYLDNIISVDINGKT